MHFRSVVQAVAGMAVFGLSAGAMLGGGGCGKTRADMPIVVPLYGAGQPNVIKDQYFVVMKEEEKDLLERTEQQARDLGGEVIHEFQAVLPGFAARLSPGALDAMRRNPTIGYVETDRMMYATGVQTCNTPSGLDRLDQGPLPLDGVYAYEKAGSGVNVFVLDTGIDGTSDEISGRVLPGWNVITKNEDALDLHGHGTHLAGIVGGKTLGVAKSANLVPIKVLEGPSDCATPPSGEMSMVAAGIDWIIDPKNDKYPGSKVLLIACEDAGNDPGNALITAIDAAIAKGIVVIASAGNSDKDIAGKAFICPEKPRDGLVVVGATGVVSEDSLSDKRWNSSNKGSCVDLYAPGDQIDSVASEKGCAPKGADRVTLSGTSQAAAHVAGIAALIMEGTSVLPGDVKGKIIGSAFSGGIQGLEDGSSNLLAQNPFSKGFTGPPDADGCNDGLKPCTGGTCGLCTDDVQCCNGLGCGGGLQCEQGNCERCGANEEPCCAGGACAASLGCVNGICTCGELSETCCAGDTCLSGDLACNKEPAVHVCENCGAETELCCSGSQCTSETLICNAAGRCESCGATDELCCSGGTCLQDNLICNGGQCKPCGTPGQLCCISDTCLSGDYDCNTATGMCENCGKAGLICCDSSCLSEDLQCNGSNQCEKCGTSGLPCCGGKCTGNLVCNASNTCVSCGGLNEVCCGGTSCLAPYDCVNGSCQDYCGGVGQTCCPGMNACDAGMDCASGKCQGACTARCKNGAFIYSGLPRTSDGDCADWATKACTNYINSVVSRIRYNGVLVGGSGGCGDSGQACCENPDPPCKPGEGACKHMDKVPVQQWDVGGPTWTVWPSSESCTP